MWTNWVLLALALALGCAAIAVFLWAVRSDQFRGVEDASFAVLRAEDEDEAHAPDDRSVRSWASK